RAELLRHSRADEPASATLDHILPFTHRHVIYRIATADLYRLYREPPEKVRWVARVFINSAEPLTDHDFLDPRHLFDLLLVGKRQWIGERDAIASNQPQGLIRGGLGEEENVIDRQQKSQQTQ